MSAFRDAVAEAHDTDYINLLFNNAGIGGGGSFVADVPMWPGITSDTFRWGALMRKSLTNASVKPLTANCALL